MDWSSLLGHTPSTYFRMSHFSCQSLSCSSLKWGHWLISSMPHRVVIGNKQCNNSQWLSLGLCLQRAQESFYEKTSPSVWRSSRAGEVVKGKCGHIRNVSRQTSLALRLPCCSASKRPQHQWEDEFFAGRAISDASVPCSVMGFLVIHSDHRSYTNKKSHSMKKISRKTNGKKKQNNNF